MADLDDLVWLGVGLLALRAWDEYTKGPAEVLKKKGAEIYDRLHDDAGHKQDLPGKAMTRGQLRVLARDAGFPEDELDTMVAIALAESGGVPNALGDSGRSVGIWQINTHAHPQYTREAMSQPAMNASAAFALSRTPLGLRHWSVYKTGSYLRYMP